MMVDQSLSRTLLPALVAAILCLGAVSSYAGDNRSDSDGNPKPVRKARTTPDRQQEALALELASAHLPELVELLDRLRHDEPRGYSRAIRDLSKSARKLQTAKERDPQLFEFELELLKANNRVNLLVARLKVRDDQEDRSALRKAIESLQQAQRARIQYEIENIERRINRANKQLESATKRLETFDEDPKARLDSNYNKLLRKAGRVPSK